MAGRLLLVGLPDDLTIHEILPRIPWYVRPVCRAASKLWKLTIDAKSEVPEIQHLTRNVQLPLLAGSILIVTAEAINKPMSLLLKDPQVLRELPPVTLFPGQMCFIFWRGRIYVWTLGNNSWNIVRDRIFKLDVGAGSWKWQSFPACRISNWFDAVCHDGKIYAQWEARGTSSDEIRRAIRQEVQVYDMETDSCTSLEKWPYSSVGVSWKGVNGSAKLAGFSETGEMVRYEAGVWKPEASVVIPPDRLTSEEIYWAAAHFIRGECFTPSLEEGFNVVYLKNNYRTQNEYIEWFSTEFSEDWSVAESSLANDLKLEAMEVVDGRLFALCRDENRKRYVMHGRIELVVMHGRIELAGPSKVVWEVFQELEAMELHMWTVMII